MARRKRKSASISGERSPAQAKQEQKTEMQYSVQVKQEQKTETQSPIQVKQEWRTDSNIDFTEEKLIAKSDSISKGKITGSKNQSINTSSEKKSTDNTFTDSENAAKKASNEPQNLTIKSENEMAEKNRDEPSDNQLSQINELAVSNDADSIKQSPKKDKKLKKKSQERFNDSLNDKDLELVSSPSMAACDTDEPHKRKHKKTAAAAADDKVSSEDNAEENILPSLCNPEFSNFKLSDGVMTVKGEGVDYTPEDRSEASTAKNEEQQRKMDKKRSANDCVLFSESKSEGNLYASVCNPNATTNLELATDVMTVSGIGVSGVDDAPDISLEANTAENEGPSKKKRKKRKRKRKMDKTGAGGETELLSNDNLEGNLHPPIFNPNTTTNVELVAEVMTGSRVSLSKGVDNTFDIRSEVDTVEAKESSKKKRKKRRMDKKRAENENELVSENNLEGNLHPSNCNPNVTSGLDLVTEVVTDSGVGLSDGVDDTSKIRSEANIVENEEPSKNKQENSKMDKKRAVNENELSSKNYSDECLHLSFCNSNATTTEVTTDSVANLSTSEIRSEAITARNKESQKEKRKRRRKNKKRMANESELSNENNSGGDIHPSDCHPNVTTNLKLATEAVTVGENILSSCVDGTSEIRSEANTVKNKDLEKNKSKREMMDKINALNDNELLSGKKSEGNLSVCNLNATCNLGLATLTMTSDRVSSSKAVDDASEIRSESNTVNVGTPKKKKKSKRKIIANSVVSSCGLLNNNMKENIQPLVEVCFSSASCNRELADRSSDEASQPVNQQFTVNETSSKGANNSSEINLISDTLKNGNPRKKNEHRKKEYKKRMIDDQDVQNKGIGVKNIEISQDNRLLPTIKNEIHMPRRFGRRKLLVLDLNGLLCQVIRGYPRTGKPYKRVNRSAVFKRPFCDDFLKFCCENFDIGVWSSRKMENVHGVVDAIMKDFRDDLLFCWSASECTYTPYKTLEDYKKPLVLKKLQKLWNKEAGNLPWELGDYSPSNTLLIDDSPYKAICNPPYTGVFPHPYNNYNDERDNALGPGGDLRVFLEGLALAEDVESYVQWHPFGKPAITSAHPSWSFYERIVNYYK